ncbi:unnamed protein product [Ceratitis capitata]|uniref:(Mediterranean fruit fly) hypothetical protein n=1 Tax=Ceratitis capitata TaxID=7213 RepID=A0A811UWZ5_CERCA|nr:unnamed protein product [Ceratitis capitata]
MLSLLFLLLPNALTYRRTCNVAISQRMHLRWLYTTTATASQPARESPTPVKMQLAAVAEAVRHKDTLLPP